MENHHEDPKPSNKWLATPILAAVLFICCVVGFLTIATGQCCGGECKEKTKTEHTTGTHGEEGDHKDVTATDSTDTVKDSTKVEEVHEEGHEEHEGH